MNVDRLARWYRWIEYAVFGRALERHRSAFLGRLATARRILILGEGDGRTLARLLDAAPESRVDVVERSAKMIALAKKRTVNVDRVRFVLGDALEMSWPEEHYEGIVTCFFLDCFTEAELRGLVEKLACALTARGEWLISEFTIPSEGWRRWKAKKWIEIMYGFFRLTTGLRVRDLPPIERVMSEAGLFRFASHPGHGDMIVSSVWKKGAAGKDATVRAIPEASTLRTEQHGNVVK